MTSWILLKLGLRSSLSEHLIELEDEKAAAGGVSQVALLRVNEAPFMSEAARASSSSFLLLFHSKLTHRFSCCRPKMSADVPLFVTLGSCDFFIFFFLLQHQNPKWVWEALSPAA